MALGAGAAGAQEGKETEPELSLEQLVELNAADLFGGKLTLERGRFKLELPGDGSFARGFDTGGAAGGGRSGFASDQRQIKDETARKALLEGAAGAFSVAGLGGGSAVSVFELEGDWKVAFKLRMTGLQAGSRFTLRFNLDPKGKEYIQSSFFQDLQLKGKGKTKSASSQDPRFGRRPDQWFDQRSVGVPVEIRFTDGTLSIRVGVRERDGPGEKGRGRGPRGGKKKARDRERHQLVEAVKLEGIEAPAGGRLAIAFEKCSFLMSDLRIEGKLPRKWLAAEVDRLRRAGKLATGSSGEAAGAKGKDKVAARPRATGKDGSDISKPDPEADDDL
ncbi:MAG: hypothetical protein HY721_21700 [Planctomycetes bacterium]|nr:hypothetical protein [Planctomycetota bacterium]